ncbi:MAG: phosphoribosylglycinamide formyltransferase [Bacteroidales bacterium]
MRKIAVFASGSGNNAENITRYFSEHKYIKVELILTNKKDAYVIKRSENLKIPCIIFSKNDLYHTDKITKILMEHQIDLVVLAGFLLLIPEHLIKAFPNKIINIHPALLPKYGGKGMYGMKVHETVKKHNEKKTGITIHYVNEKYDDGQIIKQYKCKIDPEDTPEDIARKVHELEYTYYPRVIEELLNQSSHL